MPQKNIRITEEDAQWLEDHPEINFSALAREALKDEIEMREKGISHRNKSDDVTVSDVEYMIETLEQLVEQVQNRD